MNELEAFEYRKELVSSAHKSDEFFNERLRAAERDNNAVEVNRLNREKKNAIQYNLKVAKWNPQYWEARLAKIGVTEQNESGELVHGVAKLTPSELAANARLMDVMNQFNFYSNIIEILDLGVEIPKRILQLNEVREKAQAILIEFIQSVPDKIEYDESLNYLSRVEEFAQKFSIPNEVWHPVVIAMLKELVLNAQWYKATQIIKYFPFVEDSTLQTIHKERFYGDLDKDNSSNLPEILGFTTAELESLKTISLNEILERLHGKEKKLADVLAKVPEVYFELDAILSGAVPRQSVFSRVSQEPFSRFRLDSIYTTDNDPSYRAVLQYYLGDINSGLDETRLEFYFSQKKMVHTKDIKNYGYRFYLGTNNILLERILLTNKQRQKNKKNSIDSPVFEYDISDTSVKGEVSESVDSKGLYQLAEIISRKGKDFSEKLGELDRLATDLGVSERELQDLHLAIEEFIRYTYSVNESKIGDCLLIPQDFKNFCNLKFKLPVDLARYGEFHPEWGGEGGFSPYTFYHEVNVIFGKIVLDWTITQYQEHRDKPLPYVYEIGSEFKNFGPLFKLGYGDTPNDPYPGTSFPKDYSIHYGI